MSKIFRTAPLARAVGLVLALSSAGPALAQQQHAHDDAKDLSAVIVRATPLPQTAEDLANPVEVLAGSRLDEAKANSLGETVNRLPGVQSSYFGPGVGRPIIRGLDGARVQVLNDGLASGDVSTVSVDHAVSIEPFLANQIEVLKGPATLLYGSGAIGGAVNVADGRIAESLPEEPLQGRAELRGGSVNDERTGMMRLDGSAGRFVIHADALHRETGDYEIPGFSESAAHREQEEHEHEHVEGEDHEHEEKAFGSLPNSFVRTDSGALGVSYVGERGFLGVSASLFNTRYGVPGHSHEHEHEHEEGEEEHEDEEAAEEGPVHIRLDQRRHEVRGGLDDLGVFDTLRVKLAHTDYTHTEFEGAEVGTVFDNASTELRVELAHRDWAGWDGAFGLQASKRAFVAIGEEAFVPQSDARDIGAFWIGQRAFGPLKLELGARHDRNRIEVDETVAVGPSRDFDANSLSAAARWAVTEDFHLHFGLDRSQRTPTAEELYSSGLHVATGSFEFGDPTLDVETAKRAEIGLHWHAGPLQLAASVYAVDYDDFVYLAETGIEDHGTPVRVWNQADARFTGGEAELQWTFLDNASGAWSLRAFGDVVRARLTGHGTRTVDISVPHDDHTHDYQADIALSGNLPRIAPWRAGAELRWEGSQWRANLGAVRYARQDDVAQFESETAGYTLVNAGIAWHMDTAAGNGWEVFLDGSNLLDEEARPHTSFLTDLAPLPGRNLSLGVRLFF